MTTQADKLPPQDREAEKSVLGSLIRDNRVYDDIAQVLRAEDFYFDAHQKIYTCIASLIGSSKPCDIVILFEEAIARGWQKEVTAAYLAELWECSPTAANTKYHAGIVKGKAQRRGVIHLCMEFLRDAYDEFEEAGELMARFESRVLKLSDVASSDEPTSIGDAIDQLIDDIDDRLKNKATPYIPSGLQQLDQLIGGFRPGTLSVLGARPSVGKSAIGLKFAVNSALNCGKGVLVFSLEMKAKEWAARVLAGDTEIPLNTITGAMDLNEATIRRIADGRERYQKVACWIDDRAAHTFDSLAATARRAVRRQNVGLIIVDYLQLINHSGYKSDSLAIRTGNTSRGMKQLAGELNIPVICLCQLNRECENRPDGKPRMSDLRDSGSIEQDADNVFMLWPRDVVVENVPAPAIQSITVLVEKQRNGPTGEAHVAYVRALTRFQDSNSIPRM